MDLCYSDLYESLQTDFCRLHIDRIYRQTKHSSKGYCSCSIISDLMTIFRSSTVPIQDKINSIEFVLRNYDCVARIKNDLYVELFEYNMFFQDLEFIKYILSEHFAHNWKLFTQIVDTYGCHFPKLLSDFRILEMLVSLGFDTTYLLKPHLITSDNLLKIIQFHINNGCNEIPTCIFFMFIHRNNLSCIKYVLENDYFSDRDSNYIRCAMGLKYYSIVRMLLSYGFNFDIVELNKNDHYKNVNDDTYYVAKYLYNHINTEEEMMRFFINMLNK